MAAKRKAKKQGSDPAAVELDSIKRLLILQLLTSGVEATKVAAALGIAKSSVTRLVPARKVKKPRSKR